MFETEAEAAARKAKEYLAWCRQQENDARIALANATASTKKAKEKYEQRFIEAQADAIEKLKSATR